MPGRERRPGWRIADVLDRTDLSVLLDQLAQPAGRTGPGRRWHCPVPDHDDHRASVTMHTDRSGHERWRCWSADHRGDAVDLVTAVTGQTRSDAVDWLAARAGMTPDRPLPAPRPRTIPARPAATVMDPVVAGYVRACARILAGPAGEPVRRWLNDRGIDDTTITANLLGADPGRRALRRRRGLPYGASPAATLPTLDPAGNITYVQARYLAPEMVGRKYDNPAAALAPNPRLGFTVTPGPPRGGPLLVCEGMPDALIAAQAGYTAVGLLGAAAPDDAVAVRLVGHATNTGADGIALVCDPDPAGRHVAGTLTPLLTAHGHPPVVVTPPDGADLNAWALTDPGWVDRLDRQLSGAGRPVERSEVGLSVEL